MDLYKINAFGKLRMTLASLGASAIKIFRTYQHPNEKQYQLTTFAHYA